MDDKVFYICQKWLFLFAVGMVIFGLILAVFSQAPLFDLIFNQSINVVFWGSDNLSSAHVIDFQQWIYGVLGATISGWGLSIAFIAAKPFSNRENWAWSCIASSITLWYITDTLISVYFNVYINVIINTIILLGIAAPLALSRKFFSHHHFHVDNQ
jgi:hypothetical protein